MSDDDPAPPDEVEQPRARAPRAQSSGRCSSAVLLGAAAAAVTGALSLGLFVGFAWLGLAGAPYWAVAVAVIGGVVMRRALLAEPTAVQTVLFSAATIGGALAGLWLANLLLS